MQKKIYLFVLFIHVFSLFLLTKEGKAEIKSSNSVKIRTISLKKPKIEKHVVSKPSIEKSLTSTTQNTPKKNVVTASKKTHATVVQKEENPFLSSLQRELAKLDSAKKEIEKVKHENTPLSIPTKIVFESKENRLDDDYRNLLINLFQDNLHLPSQGKVKTQITISNDGKLLEISILTSKSKENEIYLKNQLHNLNFPCFNEGEKSYIICFSDV